MTVTFEKIAADSEPLPVQDAAIETDRELVLLDQIEYDPDVTQASLASMLGVAVGTVNWHLKRMIAKGYVKVKRAQRRKLRYIITPEGLAFRARLTVNYIENSLRLYRRIRQRVIDLLTQVQEAGFDRVVIEGDGDIADICRLTCLEQGIKVVHTPRANPISTPQPGDSNQRYPVLQVHGTKVFLKMEA
jgi:DNA-binding MarR family transcriptional regulator